MTEACGYSCSSITDAGPRPHFRMGGRAAIVASGTASARSVELTSIGEFHGRLYLDQGSVTIARWLKIPIVAAADHRMPFVEVCNLEQRARNAEAIALLDSWLADESGYDAEVWPTFRKAIEEDRLSDRKRFADE